MPTPPARIVSLVPSWTETLYALGLGHAIIGVTRWCVHPPDETARVQKVGGTKDPDIVQIRALAPDLIVCEKEENRREDVEALRAAGLCIWLSEVRSVDDAARWSADLADTTGRHDAGQALADDIRHALAVPPPPRAIPIYVPIWRNPWMTLARGTYAEDILRHCGAHNVFADEPNRYPERGPDEAIEAGARAALLPTEPYPFHTKPQATDELVEAGFPRHRIHTLDGESLTWYGARTPHGLRDIRATLAALDAR